MKISDLIERNHAEIMKIAKLNGVLKLSLFGSSVRGEDTKASDIDLLVVFEEERTLFDLIRLKQELEHLLDKPVDIVTEKSVHPLIKEEINMEAMQIWKMIEFI